MKCKRMISAAALAFLVVTFSVGIAGSPSEHRLSKILHAFGGPGDGGAAIGGLVMDASGNLYGETEAGRGHQRLSSVFSARLRHGIQSIHPIQTAHGRRPCLQFYDYRRHRRQLFRSYSGCTRQSFLARRNTAFPVRHRV